MVLKKLDAYTAMVSLRLNVDRIRLIDKKLTIIKFNYLYNIMYSY